MKKYSVLILAAGKGTRMKSHTCKVLHHIAGRPMILYVLDSLEKAGLTDVSLVVGHNAEKVRDSLNRRCLRFVEQSPQLGTAHAVAAARDLFLHCGGNILIMCGDVPLITPETIKKFIASHEKNTSLLTVLTTRIDNPTGYGRIVRDSQGRIARIVEERDASSTERDICEINTGIYLVEARLVYELVDRVRPNNAQGEYYLTDIVEEAVKEGISVWPYVLGNHVEALGINRRSELARATRVIWEQVRENLMEGGVTIVDPQTAYIDAGVQIGPDTIVYPCTVISGNTVIGSDCIIESGVHILDSVLGNGVQVLQGSRLNGATVRDNASIGPMAHLRPGADIGRNARIGNFVEVKKTVIGDGTKASHLTYLGDSTIGRNVNIGCGTITCNYDGRKKHPTIIHDRCFVGSDVQFVAPVEIGEGSLIGAGSTITKDVPPNSLAVSRSRQKIYPLRENQGSGDENR
jgi:bifunctional UDP-N-acetylglucosamine pyrophosphorylase/glucosamine-1-phosphate N-acetyltransferase